MGGAGYMHPLGAGNWRQIKSVARAKWGLLSEEELDEVAGRREILIWMVQEKYGKARSDAEREVVDFYRTV